MSPTAVVDRALVAPSFLSLAEGVPLAHLLRAESGVGSVVQLIAARNGEGTSSLARDLCLIAVQEVGLRVLLLDIDGPGKGQADWVRATLAAPLSLAGSIATGPVELAVLRVGTTRLHVGEPKGDLAVPPSAWAGILNLLRARFDLVVVDCPSLARSFDGVLMAPHVDGSLLVVEAQSTRATQVQALRDRLVEIGGKVLGSILNKRRYHIPQAIYDRV
jgi:Mrp family chromosome partitioning ATPase